MKLSEEKLTEIWRSGYCAEMVRQAVGTEDSPAGSESRITWLRSHIGPCLECRFAAQLKAKEAEVAQGIGSQAYSAFLKGGDVTKRDDYNEDLTRKAITDLAKEMHAIGVGAEFVGWIAMAAERSRTDMEFVRDLIAAREPGDQ